MSLAAFIARVRYAAERDEGRAELEPAIAELEAEFSELVGALATATATLGRSDPQHKHFAAILAKHGVFA